MTEDQETKRLVQIPTAEFAYLFAELGGDLVSERVDRIMTTLKGALCSPRMLLFEDDVMAVLKCQGGEERMREAVDAALRRTDA